MLLIGGVNGAYSQNECPPTVVDIDGNDYSTVMIGTQCWMAQNMRASHDRNGNDIPLGNKLSYTVPYLYLNVSGVTATVIYIIGPLPHGFARRGGICLRMRIGHN